MRLLSMKWGVTGDRGDRLALATSFRAERELFLSLLYLSNVKNSKTDFLVPGRRLFIFHGEVRFEAYYTVLLREIFIGIVSI